MIRRFPPALVVGAAITAIMIFVSLAAPWLSPWPPNVPDVGAILEPPSWRHPAGTDALGRDILSRILWGGRASLGVAIGIVALSVGLGALLGAAVALAGGWIDTLVMRLVDISLSIPAIVIALALSAALGPSLGNLVLVLGLLGVPFNLRLFRSETLSLRERPFIAASRAMGAGFAALLGRHILPNLAPVIVTFASAALGSALVMASALSFVGLGAQPPTAEWGAMIFDGRTTIMYEWWCAVLPGLAVALSALGFILLGDGLRDWLDPRQEAR
jgi:peptide/nickel transport system permease protein